MAKIQQDLGKNRVKFAKFWKKNSKNSAIFNANFEIREQCKGVHCVDLGESFPTSIYLQNLASIQPRTSPIISYIRALGNLNLNFEISNLLFAAQRTHSGRSAPAALVAGAVAAGAAAARKLALHYSVELGIRSGYRRRFGRFAPGSRR